MTTLSPGRAPLAPGSPTVIGIVEGRAVDLDEAGGPGLEVCPDENPGGARDDLDDASFGVQVRRRGLLG